MTMGITVLALFTFFFIAIIFDITFNTKAYRCYECKNIIRKKINYVKISKSLKCKKCKDISTEDISH